MQRLRKPLSFLLSIVMIVSMFTIIPVSAATTDNAPDSGSYSVELAGEGEAGLSEIASDCAAPEIIDNELDPTIVAMNDVPALDEEGSDTIPVLSARTDRAEVAADQELVATAGTYNIAIGRVAVTENNYSDVLGDGTVSYDPVNKILTLREPVLYGPYSGNPEFGAIHIQVNGVTVRGSYHMTNAISNYGLCVSEDNHVNLEGDFTFRGTKFGIVSDSMTINSGTVKAISTNKHVNSAGIYCDNLIINRGITSVEMQCASCAYEGDLLTMNGVRVTSDDSFFFATSRAILNPDFNGFATRVVIKPWSGTYYGLWLGTRAVDSDNYTDIYGDGTASYDPTNKILTLNDPNIRGVHPTTGLGINFKIYSENDLTVRGSYKMTPDQLVILPDDTPEDDEDNTLYTRTGISSNGSLTLDGDFAFYAHTFPVVAENNVTISSGTVKAAGSDNFGIASISGALTIKSTVTKIDAEAEIYALAGKTALTIESGVHISTPRNNAIAPSNNYYIVVDASTNKPAKHVVIETGTVEDYNLFIGQVDVTSLNCDDVLGDGTVSYSPSTKTLILHDPVINGTVQNGSTTYKILTSLELTVKGSYHMTEADADANIAISSTKTLTFDGDFTIRGQNYAVYAPKGVTINGGTMTAISAGVGAIGAPEGEFRVNNGITKVDMQGAYYNVLAKTISLRGVSITVPTAHKLIQMFYGEGEDQYYYTIGTSAGATVTHAVLESITGELLNVWLGNKPVTTTNYSDIYKDGGSAVYDPDTKTLTLNNAPISNFYRNGNNTFKIFSIDALTVEGNFAMEEADVTIGLFSNDTLTLNGDFDIHATAYAVYAAGSITVSGGSLTANGGTIGVISNNGSVTFGNAVIKVDATGGSSAILGDPLSLSDELVITTPEGGTIGSVSGYQGVLTSGGSPTGHAVIERKPTPTEPPTDPPTDPPAPTAKYYVVCNFTDWAVDEAYLMTKNTEATGEEYVFSGIALTTSSQFKIVKVLSGEMTWYPDGMGNNYGENGEITSDGTYDVYFRPDYDGGEDWFYGAIYVAYEEPYTEYNIWLGSTRVTSANKNNILGDGKAQYDPTAGVLTLNDPAISGTHSNAKIYIEATVTLAGSYHMTSAETIYGLKTNQCYLTLSGDFTFMGSQHGLYSNQYLTIASGSLHAVGNTYNGVYSNWEMTIGANAQRIELEGVTAAYAGNRIIVQGDQQVVLPVGGSINNRNIYEADGRTIAKHAVIEKPAPAELTLEGEGTDEAPYLIKTADDWDAFTSYVAAGNDVSGKCFKLDNDITVTTAISTNPFTGVFDGDGHTLTLDNLSSSPFGNLSGATIKNLKIDGSVSGGRHVSALGSAGTADSLIENCVVTADIATNDTYCGGFIGHGGSTATVTLKNCVFAGTFSQGSTIGTFWGWSDAGSTPVLENCLDLSATNHPIGRGSTGTVTNCYYTNATKQTDGARPWSNGGKRAFTVTGDDVDVTLNGTTGLTYDGLIYAAEGETISLTAADAEKQYTASAGTLTQNGSALTLTMPAENVIIFDADEPYTEYKLWLGTTRVTSTNRRNILGGGKAQYDPDTNTLTLNNPVINGFYGNAKIYTEESITIEGSYHMTSAGDAYGIQAKKSNLVLNGSFTFLGWDSGVYCYQYLTIASGTVKAVGNSGSGIYSWSEMTIKENAQKVDMNGYSRAYGGSTVTIEGDQELILPEGGSFGNKTILEADGTTVATHAIIEKPNTGLQGVGTESNPYLIKTTKDWEAFKNYIANGGKTSGKFFLLANDITVTNGVGSSEYPFSGTFDGGGKTLTFNATSSNGATAPFVYASGAVFIHLHTAGTIQASSKYAAGLIGEVNGDVTITDCRSSVTIDSSVNGDGTHGGFVGVQHEGITTVKGCVFDGKLLGENTDRCGGFIGWRTTTLDIYDSVFAPAEVTVSSSQSATFARNKGNTYNSYYTYLLNDGQNFAPYLSDSSTTPKCYNNGQQAYTVSAAEGITLSYGDPAENGVYEVSGITSYGTGLTYGGAFYGSVNDRIALTAEPEDKQYMPSAGAISQNGGELTLTMPASNVVIMESDDNYSDYSDITASSGYNNEGAENLFDGKTNTKWCGSTNDGTPVVMFRTDTKIIPSGYKLATAGDTAGNPKRNPISWKLEASNDGLNWVTIADVSDNHTLEAVNEKYYTFPLTNPTTEAYSLFRFTIRQITGDKTYQISELQLIGDDTGDAFDPESITYELWLGSTQVTYANRNDILGDGGKAQFNPMTNTLTLNNPTIEGVHLNSGDGCTYKIMSYVSSLTVKGNYHMSEAEADYGIHLSGAPVLDGNFTFMAKDRAVNAGNTLTLRSGSLKAYCTNDGANSYPINTYNKLVIEDNVTLVEAQGGYAAISQYSGDTAINSKFLVTVPENATYGQDPRGSSAHYFFNEDGTIATHVIIEKNTTFNIWVGETQVTVHNRRDILGDGGKAQFDPSNNTLTLNDPEISGTHSNAKICTHMTITVAGSYHMTSAETSHGLYSINCNLTLGGDFTFMGSSDGIYSDHYLTIASGSLHAVGNGDNGIYSYWEMFIGENAQRIELEGGARAYFGNKIVPADNMVVTDPVGGYFGYYIYDAAGNSIKHAVIEPGHWVSFDVKGIGNAPARRGVGIGKALTKPDDPTNNAYHFVNWYADKDLTQLYDFDTAVEENMTLYAKWEKNVYTVDFDMNGYGAAPDEVPVEHGGAAIKPDDPTEPGYRFIGWYSDKDCTEAYDFSAPVTQSITLYAKWEAEEYTITFLANNGTDAKYYDPNKFHYGDEYVLPKCIFAPPEEKRFDCWNRGAIGETITITGNTELKAQWRNIYRLGDVDGDVKVDIFDASAIQKSLSGMGGYPKYSTMDPTSPKFMIADVDGDGKVDIFDASLVQKYIAGDAAAKAFGIAKPIES